MLPAFQLIDPMCGSGTIAIEAASCACARRLGRAAAVRAVRDPDVTSLACCPRSAVALGLPASIHQALVTTRPQRGARADAAAGYGTSATRGRAQSPAESNAAPGRVGVDGATTSEAGADPRAGGAALRASLLRNRFNFEYWPTHDAAAYRAWVDRLCEAVRGGSGARVHGRRWHMHGASVPAPP